MWLLCFFFARDFMSSHLFFSTFHNVMDFFSNKHYNFNSIYYVDIAWKLAKSTTKKTQRKILPDEKNDSATENDWFADNFFF